MKLVKGVPRRLPSMGPNKTAQKEEKIGEDSEDELTDDSDEVTNTKATFGAKETEEETIQNMESDGEDEIDIVSAGWKVN
jgi:hypothetical protein